MYIIFLVLVQLVLFDAVVGGDDGDDGDDGGGYIWYLFVTIFKK